MVKGRSRKRHSPEGAQAQAAAAIPIGERLRQMRESRGLDVATVAERLHLKQVTVRALEEEDFSRLPARVFVRGYYRNYARLMELPEEQLLREFDARCPEGEECSAAPPVVAQGVRKEIRSSHGLVKLVTWLVVISLLAAFGLWWKDYTGKQQAQVAEEAAPAAPAVAAAGNEPPAGPDAAPEPPAAAPPPAPSVAPVEEEAGSTPPPAPEEASPAPAPEASAPPPVTAESRAVPTPPKVVLRFDQDSWVDIRGANRSFKLVGTRRAGETIVLEGEPPYNLIIGNARGVTILVDGRPLDFSDKTRRNVARLTLEP